MAAQIYFADMRVGLRENLHAKLERLTEQAGVSEVVSNGDLVAIKMHFGEKGGHAYIRPTFVRRVVDQVKANNGKPFLTDSSSLYPGERKEAVSALTCAIENGFADALIVLSHFKCHELTGLGGAIKKLAMGCSSRE